MADASANAIAEATRAAMEFSASVSTTGVSVTVKIDNTILAGVISVGALSLAAYYLKNKRPVETALRNGLESRNEAGQVDPEVRNIESGSILVKLHCYSEHSFIQFVEDFDDGKVSQRLSKEFTEIGYPGQINVTIENGDEVYKKVEAVRLSQKESMTKNVRRKDRRPWKAENKELSSESRIKQENSDLRRTLPRGTVKHGTPTNDELEKLGIDISCDWIKIGRHLGVKEGIIQEIDQTHDRLSEKGYHVLKRWQQDKGTAATYQSLCDVLQHKLVQRQDLAEMHFYVKGNQTCLQCHELEKEIEQLTVQVKDQEQEIEKLRGEKSQLSSHMKKRGRLCNQTTKDLETKNKNLKQQNKSLLSKIDTQKSEKERLQMENKSIAKENADSLQKIEVLEKEIKGLKTENERLQTKLETKEYENCKLQGNQTCLKCHEEELEHLKPEMEQIKEQYREAEVTEANPRPKRLDPVRVKDLGEELEHSKTETEQLKLKHKKEKQALVTEEQNRDAKLRDVKRPNPVQVKEQEQEIENPREEITDIDFHLPVVKKNTIKLSHGHQRGQEQATPKSNHLANPSEDFLQKFESMKKENEELKKTNANLQLKIKGKEIPKQQFRKVDNKSQRMTKILRRRGSVSKSWEK